MTWHDPGAKGSARRATWEAEGPQARPVREARGEISPIGENQKAPPGIGPDGAYGVHPEIGPRSNAILFPTPAADKGAPGVLPLESRPMPGPPPKLAPPVPYDGTAEQYRELIRLASEGWTVPLAVGGRVVVWVGPSETKKPRPARP